MLNKEMRGRVDQSLYDQKNIDLHRKLQFLLQLYIVLSKQVKASL